MTTSSAVSKRADTSSESTTDAVASEENVALNSEPSHVAEIVTPEPVIGKDLSSAGIGQDCVSDTQCSKGNACYQGKCQRYWESLDFSRGMFGREWKVHKETHGKGLRSVVADPAGSDDLVLQVKYPKGSRTPGGLIKGGFGVNFIIITFLTLVVRHPNRLVKG